jgi:hypothetical protein
VWLQNVRRALSLTTCTRIRDLRGILQTKSYQACVDIRARLLEEDPKDKVLRSVAFPEKGLLSSLKGGDIIDAVAIERWLTELLNLEYGYSQARSRLQFQVSACGLYVNVPLLYTSHPHMRIILTRIR